MRARPGAERKLEPPWAIGVGDTEKVLTPKKNDAEVGKRGRPMHLPTYPGLMGAIY